MTEKDLTDLVIRAVGKVLVKGCTPCDFCRYDPPSSLDGKPCTICPAEKKVTE